MASIVIINKCGSTSTHVMPCRRHAAEGRKQTISVQMQPNHGELDERPLCGICAGRNKYGKKKRQRIVWNFFFKTVCNTNPAKTIVQKVTKQQSLGLMQYRLYRNSHDEMCRSGTVNTKEPRRRLIFQTTVCVLDFSPKISIQQTDI